MTLFSFLKKASARSNDSSSPYTLKIVIPFYVYPTVWEENNEWKTLAETASTCKVPITAIVNPNNGPGDEPNSDYLTGIDMLRNAGIEVIGYIHSQYGDRPLDAIKEDMKKWETFYQIEGVFIDEVASEHIKIELYKTITKECRDCGSHIVVLNPGISPDAGYFEIAEVVVVFENYAKEWNGQVVGTDNAQCCVLVHTCADVDAMKTAIDRVIEAKIGYCYVTNDEMPNPWDCLPSYWTDMIDYLNEKVAGGQLLEKTTEAVKEHCDQCEKDN